jgi:hypothetical protein
LRRILALALLVCLSTAAHASVVWRGDFETADLSQWTHFEGLASRLTVVPSPVRQGKYALRTELRQGDIASNGTRNEMDWVYQQTEGMDLYYAWSTLFPAEYPKVTGFQTFTQWHHNVGGGAPPLHFDVLVDQIVFVRSTGGYQALWSAPLVRGVWHDFVLHVKWSADASTGFVELWYDGQKVLEKTAGATLIPGTWVYLKQGLYRDNAIVPVAVLYHDGMTVATTLEDVLPASSASPPEPPPTSPPPSTGGAPETQPATPQPLLAAGGCASAPVDLFALFGIAAFALRRRRKS